MQISNIKAASDYAAARFIGQTISFRLPNQSEGLERISGEVQERTKMLHGEYIFHPETGGGIQALATEIACYIGARPDLIDAINLQKCTVIFRVGEQATRGLRNTNTQTKSMLASPEYRPEALLNFIISRLGLKNDAQLADALELRAPTISKIRNRKLAISPAFLIRVHDVTDISVFELRRLIGHSGDSV
jgi:hypothetical protein